MYRLWPPKFRSPGRCRCPVFWHLHLFCIYLHLFTYNRIYRVPNVPSFCARPKLTAAPFIRLSCIFSVVTHISFKRLKTTSRSEIRAV